MVNLANYATPQPLRRLIEDILSPEELQRYGELNAILKSIDWLVRDERLVDPELDKALEEELNLRITMDERARAYLAAGGLLVCGWPDHISSDVVPVILSPDILADSQTSLETNTVDAARVTYESCTLLLPDSLIWKSGGSPKRGKSGRSPDEQLKAAVMEALRRVRSGGKKDVVAEEVAKEYGVNAATLRSYLKPSRLPDYAKH